MCVDKLVPIVLCRKIIDLMAARLVPVGHWRPVWVQDVILSTYDFYDEHGHFPFLAGYGREEIAKLGCSIKPCGEKTEMQMMQIVVAKLLVDSPAWCPPPPPRYVTDCPGIYLCGGAPRSPGGLVPTCVLPIPCSP